MYYACGIRRKDSQGEGKWDGANVFVSKDGIESVMSALFMDERDYINNESWTKNRVIYTINELIHRGDWIKMTLNDIKMTSGIQDCELWV